MSNSKRYTITAALPYTNGPVHIGHLAGVYIPADIYARYLRMTGNDVIYICGSDEHGVPITIKAKKEGISPQDVVDKYHAIIKKSFEDFGISFDNYSRTSAEIHHKTASEFFKKLYDEGKFIEETSEQLYDEEAHQFLADRFVVGTCPKCGNEESYGDQCEKCGTSLNATDLINPRSAITGNIPTKKMTKHWYLPLEKYEKWLREWIVEGHKNDWKPNVLGQVKSWLDDGLKPRAVTRDLDWGIPVPVKGAEGKVLYVWFDAPIGYISSTKEWAAREGKDWEPYWKDKDTKLIHFIGKDNIVFHCIIFPAMLKAEGTYILPENVPANEFLNLEGNKISTSKNWAVWLHEYLEDFPDKQDVLRYALTANAPETKDNDFTWKDFQAKNNNELVAIFGNFINRVVVLTNKYYNGIVPEPNEFTDIDNETLEKLQKFPSIIGSSIVRFRFREASQELLNLARLGNKYLADEEPWKTVKDDEERVKTVMYIALQIAAALAVLSEPFLPFTSAKLKKMLQLGANELHWNTIEDTDKLLSPDHQIVAAELLFAKIEDSEIEAQLAKLEATKLVNIAENSVVEAQKETIEFDDFTKLDIRVGTILSLDDIEKSDKMVKLQVDFGDFERTILVGMKGERDNPSEIVGQQALFVVNLPPKKMFGEVSEGVLFDIGYEDGIIPVLAQPENKVPDGTRVG